MESNAFTCLFCWSVSNLWCNFIQIPRMKRMSTLLNTAKISLPKSPVSMIFHKNASNTQAFVKHYFVDEIVINMIMPLPLKGWVQVKLFLPWLQGRRVISILSRSNDVSLIENPVTGAFGKPFHFGSYVALYNIHNI